MIDPTARFSGRADDYAKARPGYPTEVLGVLRDACGLDAGSVVADLGSGTGIFTRLLLESGATVHAVEPNADMRRDAESALASWPGFRSVGAPAEATTLETGSIDLVTAAQAFHWFDPMRVKQEMKRILRNTGPVALVWNDCDLAATAFLREYEALLVARCPKYKDLQGKADTPSKFDALFGPSPRLRGDGERRAWTKRVVPNEQRLDRAGLLRRLASSSYAPKPGEPTHQATYAELEAIFERHAVAGEVVMTYTVVVILGKPS